jgi:hypothetical protein
VEDRGNDGGMATSRSVCGGADLAGWIGCQTVSTRLEEFQTFEDDMIEKLN